MKLMFGQRALTLPAGFHYLSRITYALIVMLTVR